ncbi:MAG: PAS domain S-box protein, partial [Rhodospirillales bacterium]
MIPTKARLILTTTGCVAVIFLGVVAHYVGASNARMTAEEVNRVIIPEVLAIQDMRYGVVRIVASTTELLLIRLDGVESEQTKAGERDFIEKGSAIFVDALRRYTTLHHRLAEPNKESFVPTLSAAYDALLKTSQDLVALHEQGKSIVESKEVFEDQERAVLEIIDTHFSVEIGDAKRALRQSVQNIDKMVFLTVAIGAIAVAVFVGYGFYVVGVFRVLLAEVVERKKAEEQLHKLSLAVEQSPASVVITDTDGTIEYVNKRFTEITGYSSEEAIGQNPGLLKSGETSDAVYENLWATIKSGEEWHGTLRNKRKDGSVYLSGASISPIIGQNGT